MTDAIVLEACDVHKAFASKSVGWFRRGPVDQTMVVQGVSFRLRKGRALGVVGESGSGKTTLIRMLAGLLSPTSGDIVVGGSSVHLDRDRRARRRVQMVFQDPTESLNPSFSVERIIGDPLLRLCDLERRSQLDEEVARLADLVHLPRELLTRYPHQLSGGQKARVGIARALAAGPDVLLLDEPTTALDVSVQARILLLLDRLRRELELSFVFVSHDLSVVRLICDDVMIMKAGSVVETGSVQEVFEHSTNEYTRALLRAIPNLGKTGTM